MRDTTRHVLSDVARETYAHLPVRGICTRTHSGAVNLCRESLKFRTSFLTAPSAREFERVVTFIRQPRHAISKFWSRIQKLEKSNFPRSQTRASTRIRAYEEPWANTNYHLPRRNTKPNASIPFVSALVFSSLCWVRDCIAPHIQTFVSAFTTEMCTDMLLGLVGS